MHLFYTPNIQHNQSHYQLAEEESKHAIRVLRLNQGNQVILIDGVGGWYEAVIQDAHPKRTSLEVVSYTAEFEKFNYKLHIAIAPTKNIDRLEWFLEKATEIGIHEISLLISEHSERKEVKVDRLNKVVVSAMKQSLKAYKPIINAPVTFDKFISLFADKPEIGKAIAHCEPGDNKKYLNKVFEIGK
ncbi:MAG: RsmE family RNA methyltransferase, partial [Sphingobacterium sp.]